nr:MAG TPA: hypothetical protein [Caudoviricetes sp.]
MGGCYTLTVLNIIVRLEYIIQQQDSVEVILCSASITKAGCRSMTKSTAAL